MRLHTEVRGDDINAGVRLSRAIALEIDGNTTIFVLANVSIDTVRLAQATDGKMKALGVDVSQPVVRGFASNVVECVINATRALHDATHTAMVGRGGHNTRGATTAEYSPGLNSKSAEFQTARSPQER